MIQPFGRKLSAGKRRPERVVTGIGQKAVGKGDDGSPHRVRKPVADARPGLERVLMVALDYAFGGGVAARRHARDVQQPVEDGEVGILVLVEHALQVELHKREPHQAARAAQQAQLQAVCNQRVQVLGQIEVLLHQSVGRHAGTAALALSVQAVVETHYVYGKTVPVLRAVADGVRLAVHRLGPARFRLVAQKAQERNHEKPPGLRGARFALLYPLHAMAEHLPQVARVRPRADYFFLNLRAGIQAEVFRRLASRLALLQRIEDVGRKDGAFYAYRRIFHFPDTFRT
ncbi:MAG: hypothetical protein BWY96_02390 [Spirochaetes bacterium ADurb.BinA120]|nr:MAG: hypothetical protein BWY96_02390 [Spirochaetes bacterium ADurb.BinA120]